MPRRNEERDPGGRRLHGTSTNCEDDEPRQCPRTTPHTSIHRCCCQDLRPAHAGGARSPSAPASSTGPLWRTPAPTSRHAGGRPGWPHARLGTARVAPRCVCVVEPPQVGPQPAHRSQATPRETTKWRAGGVLYVGPLCQPSRVTLATSDARGDGVRSDGRRHRAGPAGWSMAHWRRMSLPSAGCHERASAKTTGHVAFGGRSIRSSTLAIVGRSRQKEEPASSLRGRCRAAADREGHLKLLSADPSAIHASLPISSATWQEPVT